MPRVETKQKGQKHLCSNPNCRHVFSKPKIIKYYVCPTCQTLVNIDDIADPKEIESALATRKLPRIKKLKTTKTGKREKEKKSVIQVESEHLEPENPCETREESPAVLRTPASIELPVQTPLLALPAPMKVPVEERTAVSAPQFGCQYGFGYLRQRKRGKRIPDTCIECAKALECLLSDYHQKEESVKEIKKWYSP